MAPPEVVSTNPCPLVQAFKERPILFSAPMVRALLEGTKTQTRRVVKNTITEDRKWVGGGAIQRGDEWFSLRDAPVLCPYGQPGDRLWVRETWRHRGIGEDGHADRGGYVYRATENVNGPAERWIPSIHMLRAASRIDLEVTGVRVERLQDISEADAIAEGCEAEPFPGPWWQGYKRTPDGELVHQQATGESPPDWMVEPHRMRDMSNLNRSARDAFQTLWGQINGPDSWTSNRWVWVIAFRRLVSGNSSSINRKATQ